MKQSLLWALAFLAATLLAQACTSLLHALTTHALPLPLAAHLRARLPQLQHAAPAISARLQARLTGVTSTLTLLLLPAALLFPGLVENWPAFLTVSLPAVRLSLERIGEVSASGDLFIYSVMCPVTCCGMNERNGSSIHTRLVSTTTTTTCAHKPHFHHHTPISNP